MLARELSGAHRGLLCASPRFRVPAHVLRLASDIPADPWPLWELTSNSRVCRRNSFTTWMDVASGLCEGGFINLPISHDGLQGKEGRV
jgi:hypothetical protein